MLLPPHPVPGPETHGPSRYPGSCAHKKYKLTCAGYDQMREVNGGRCWLCDKPEILTHTWRLLIPDHDHKLGTWAVRGLLCSGCNVAVDVRGKKPSPKITDRLDEYLTNPWHKIQGLSGPAPLSYPERLARHQARRIARRERNAARP